MNKKEFERELNHLKLNDKVDSFELLLKHTLSMNEKFNLTAITDKDETEEKHFIDSLFMDRFVNLDNKEILDVGSGAGFPGLALAIAHPKAKVTLLESNGKKVSFLKEMVKELELPNANVIQGRAEEFDKRESYDIVTARAVKELNILLEICMHLVKVGGLFIAYKSSNVNTEIEHAKHAFKVLDISKFEVKEYKLPKSQDNRVLLIILKDKITKKKYPRRYSEISKTPL